MIIFLEPTIVLITWDLWFAKVIIFLIRTTQVFIFDVFFDPQLDSVEEAMLEYYRLFVK